MTAVERLLAKVDVGGSPAGCWMWAAGLESGGYGTFRLDGQMRRAHRAAYELLVGPIPDSAELDHLCRERACVNPLHLEPVTHHENGQRGRVGYRSEWAACPQGHPFNDLNTYVTPDGRRQCRPCQRARHATRRALLGMEPPTTSQEQA